VWKKMSRISPLEGLRPVGATRIRRSIAPGLIVAISAAVQPPIEWPSRCGRPSPAASIR
jgi:hypothetical protein